MKSLLFDIGANHGKYTQINRKKYDECVLVEANPFLIQELKDMYKEDSNVHVVHRLVSNKETEAFYLSNADTISTSDVDWITKSRFTPNYVWFEPIRDIPTITLDKLVELYGVPDLIKIDVEGYEHNVLLSLTKKVPKICFEWAEEKESEMLKSIEYLHKIGFTKFHIQFEDNYTYDVKEEDLCNFQMVYMLIESICDVNRKERWGMIWAL
jgi:FkbM family methyltransferase